MIQGKSKLESQSPKIKARKPKLENHSSGVVRQRKLDSEIFQRSEEFETTADHQCLAISSYGGAGLQLLVNVTF
jgi:hypothetical protein